MTKEAKRSKQVKKTNIIHYYEKVLKRDFKRLPLDPYDSMDAEYIQAKRDRENLKVGIIIVIFFAILLGWWGISKVISDNNIKARRDECLAKAPYFAYKVNGEYFSCERVLYTSKDECIADGREKTVTDPDSGEPYHIYCKDDGSWGSKWVGRGQYDDGDILAKPEGRYTCTDVTSYNYDWQDDMHCTAPDGTEFYTSYEGASYYESL